MIRHILAYFRFVGFFQPGHGLLDVSTSLLLIYSPYKQQEEEEEKEEEEEEEASTLHQT